MALTTWSFPTSIVFGPGALSALPARIALLNAKRPLLVCDAGVVKAGLAAKVQKVLESAGLPVAVFDKVDAFKPDVVFNLCETFFSDRANRRTDAWGGPLENRARLIFEIIDGVRSACRPDFKLGLRFLLSPPEPAPAYPLVRKG